MKQGLIQEIAKFIKEYRMKKQWQMAATVMAVIVVFMTTYSLILPAITMTKDTGTPSSYVATSSNCATDSNYRGGSGGGNYSERAATDSDAMATDSNATPYYCGFEAHTHGRECYDAEGNLTCELTVHVHTEECLVEFTEEELALIQSVIDMIAELPTSEEAEAALAAFEEAGDKEGYEAYVKAIAETAWAAYDAYEALSEELKAKVTNIELLRDLEWLWSKTILFEYPSLEADDAYVSKLKVKSSKVLTDSEEELDPMLVQNSDSIEYQFSVETDCYSDMYYSEGRVRVEFVLPLATEQAEFDLTEMNWLDNSEGFEAEITTEERTVGGEEIECQILTGYKYFASEEASEEVIPGSFTGNVVVSVNEMEHNAEIAILISAAMEHNEWDGECTEHERKEKLTITTDEYKVYAPLSPEEQKVIYEAFLVEVEEAEMNGLWTEELRAAAEELLERVKEAFEKGEIGEEYYIELSDRLNKLLETEFDPNTVGEMYEGTNWMRLRDSGWFEEYSNAVEEEELKEDVTVLKKSAKRMLTMNARGVTPPSDVQVVKRGGSETSADGAVTVSKTIAGTELENIFDITLQVQTETKIEELYEDPDMAVVIVMDISATMREDFGSGTKYQAAIEAAEDFVDLFAENNTTGVSKIGYVAFNTDGHKICDMQSCFTTSQATSFKNNMRTKTGNIINPDSYTTDEKRYTNIEVGLEMAQDMLSSVANRNKYILFLSDGLPTTYIKSGYTGYHPVSSSVSTSNIGKDGYFYDKIYGRAVAYGCNYSDKGAEKAVAVATSLKNSGVKIFSVGAGLNTFSGTYGKGLTGAELIQDQLKRAAEKGVSTVDNNRTSASEMNIGSLSDSQAFEKWLGNRIGSGYDGYYYETTDKAGLLAAYNGIFAKIKHDVEESSQADWVSRDPIPTVSGSAETVEFIGFYNKAGELVSTDLSGQDGLGKENTASFDYDATYAIDWDLKDSGYQTSTEGSVTKYTYQLVYRVRLKNENQTFVENHAYPTNDTTSLTYRFVESVDGKDVISDPKTVNFPIPAVKGYLGELEFQKVDSFGEPVVGAEFTLAHDTTKCSICKGDETTVTVANKVSTSGADGNVTFTKVPSGHLYTLTETVVPNGYHPTGNVYSVEVAYDVTTVNVTDENGSPLDWTSTITNHTSYELPQTGGPGIWFCTLSGLLLTVGAMIFGFIQRRRQERRVL